MNPQFSRRAIYQVVGVDFTVFGIVYPILPLFARGLGLSVPAIGMLLGCYSLCQLALATTWGRLSDRFGRRPVLLAALTGTFASTVLVALAQHPATLFLALALNGASGGSMVVAQAAVVDVTPPEDRAKAMGHIGACIALGFVLGPALAALAGVGGARLPFTVAGVLAGANLVSAYRVFPETVRFPERDAPAPDRSVQRSAPQRGGLRRVLWSVGLVTGAFGALETTFALIGRRHFGFGEVGTGLCFALLGVVMAIAQARGSALVARAFGKRTAVSLGGLLLVVGLVGIGLTHSYGVLLVSIACVGLGYGLLAPVLTAAVANSCAPRRSGATMGLQQSVGLIARIVAPLIAASAFAGGGAVLVVALSAAATLGAVVLVADRQAGELVNRTSLGQAKLDLG